MTENPKDAAEPPVKERDTKPVPSGATGEDSSGNLDAVLGIPVTVQVILGTTEMPVARIIRLGRGAVITLDRRIGEPVDVVVNGRVVARGEIVGAENDAHFGVSLTEIVGRPTLDGG